MHIAIGHYHVGANDGVNTVIWRTVNGLLQLDPTLRITLFGKEDSGIGTFLPWHNGQLRHRNIPQMSPDYPIPGLESKSVQSQRVHDYIWHGTNVADQLQDEFADADVVLMENLSVGVNPALIYAFYLWTQSEYQAGSRKRFLVRVHDFAQERPGNFDNIKKFQRFLPSEMPDWHQILYPSTPNVEYIAINTTDYYRLLEHGINAHRVWYVPNCIDDSLTRLDEPCEDLRRLLVQQKGIAPDAGILFYPVRAIPRKNVEESIYLLCLLNNLRKEEEFRQKYGLTRDLHLVVSLGGSSPQEKEYTKRLQEFAAAHDLPVTIDISDLVGLHREYDPDDPNRIVKHGVADMYSIAQMTVSTSLLEGFGFVFIEPWSLGQCVIGRNIPSVTMDFKKAGLSLDHLYSVLLVNGKDYADLGAGDADGGLGRRLAEISQLNDPVYLRRIINKNSAPLRATLKLFRPEHPRSLRRTLIRTNRGSVLRHYSISTVVGQLYRIMLDEEPSYVDPRSSQDHPKGGLHSLSLKHALPLAAPRL